MILIFAFVVWFVIGLLVAINFGRIAKSMAKPSKYCSTHPEPCSVVDAGRDGAV